MAEENTQTAPASAKGSGEAKEESTQKIDEASIPATSEKETAEIPAKFEKIVGEIEKMSVLDLNELVKTFEKKFGVSAAAVASVPAAAGAVEAQEEKTTVNVELSDAGGNKIGVIKAIKDVLGLGLKEVKDLVDAAPSIVKTDMKKEEAEELKKKIEEAGGKVTLK